MGWPPRTADERYATRGAGGAAGEAGGGRWRVRRRPPNPPSGPAHEEHDNRARMQRLRRENRLLRGAHRHQRREGGESAREEWAAEVRPSLRRPPRDHRRRGCQKIRRGAPKKNSPWPIPRRPGLRPRWHLRQSHAKFIAVSESPIWLVHMRCDGRLGMRTRERAGGFCQG